MHHVFVKPEQLTEEGKVLRITGEDFHHIVRVLRMKEGEELSASVLAEDEAQEENAAAEYRFGIEEITEDALICRLRFVKEERRELPARITLLQCLPKSDKMEQIIQKAVELGAARVVPVAMKRCVAKLDEKKAPVKVKRWNAISESAAKQSKRLYIPQVGDVASFGEMLRQAQELDLVLVPYELAEDAAATRQAIEQIRPGMSVGIVIGPEGGLEREEVEKLLAGGAVCITLGRRILRTETAGMALLAHLMLRLELK